MKRAMTTKELEASARQAVARMLEDGEAGKLDGLIYAALLEGLAQRRGTVLPAPKRTARDGES